MSGLKPTALTEFYASLHDRHGGPRTREVRHTVRTESRLYRTNPQEMHSNRWIRNLTHPMTTQQPKRAQGREEREGEVSNCVQCGSEIPDGQRTCSMCYGDIAHGKDGYYEQWALEQLRQEEESRQLAEQQHGQEMQDANGNP